MKIWLLLLIPIAVTVGMLMCYRKKVSWWEYLSLFRASALIILICNLIITRSMTSDTEYWSESAYKVVYDGAWDEWIVDECSYDCFCNTDDDGNERELHNDLAIDAIDFNADNDFRVPYNQHKNQSNKMVSCPYFTTNFINLNEKILKENIYDSFIIYNVSNFCISSI